MELLTGIFSAFGLSASAGLNAYIPLLAIGIIDHYTDLLSLEKPWDTLSNPWILILLGILLIIEMLADKIPAVNHLNDLIQTVVRPAAGGPAVHGRSVADADNPGGCDGGIPLVQSLVPHGLDLVAGRAGVTRQSVAGTPRRHAGRSTGGAGTQVVLAHSR